jgi:hypothetical protein
MPDFQRLTKLFVKHALAQYFTPEEFLRRMKVYEAGTEALRHMIVPLCQWGTTERHLVLATSILELSSDGWVNQGSYSEMWERLRIYHSLLLLYAGGVAALSAENYQMFAAVLTRPRYRDLNGECHLLLECCTPRVFRVGHEYLRPPSEGHGTAASDHLFDLLRTLMEVSLPSKNRYEECFDRFEYLVALVFCGPN